MRVAGNYGFLPGTLAKRWISDAAWAHLPAETEEVALVAVVDSSSGKRSTIIGDARSFRAYVAGLDELKNAGDPAYAKAASADLSILCPIERPGHPEDWVAELVELQTTAPTDPASFSGSDGTT
jgi:hypothetical protein